MRYWFFILVIVVNFVFCTLSCAAEDDKNASWGANSSVFNEGFSDQKPVTDASFQKTVKMLKERSLSKKQKKLRNEVQPFSPMSDETYLKNFVDEQTAEDGTAKEHTVMIPMKAYSSTGEVIFPGYYRLSCRKIAKDMYMLDLSQGTNKVLSVTAQQTKQDLGADTLSFGDAKVIDDSRIRLIYGTIELNLVGYLYFK
ncbi:hypothetical protein IJD44_11270 [bacterium]|nr:hypothetical protein [bacterium]